MSGGKGTPAPRPGYRPCVGVMLFNADAHVFVGQRNDIVRDAWQMPQGGIDPGETPADAALRELEEEIGTAKAEIVAETAGWLSYDFPPELIGQAWGGHWKGQTQKWFAVRFLGSDADIDLATAHPEFDAWRWAPLDQLPELIVAFKRQLYLDLVCELGPAIRAAAGG